MLLVRNSIGGCTKYFGSILVCFSFTKYFKWLIVSLNTICMLMDVVIYPSIYLNLLSVVRWVRMPGHGECMFSGWCSPFPSWSQARSLQRSPEQKHKMCDGLTWGFLESLESVVLLLLYSVCFILVLYFSYLLSKHLQVLRFFFFVFPPL